MALPYIFGQPISPSPQDDGEAVNNPTPDDQDSGIAPYTPNVSRNVFSSMDQTLPGVAPLAAQESQQNAALYQRANAMAQAAHANAAFQQRQNNAEVQDSYTAAGVPYKPDAMHNVVPKISDDQYAQTLLAQQLKEEHDEASAQAGNVLKTDDKKTQQDLDTAKGAITGLMPVLSQEKDPNTGVLGFGQSPSASANQAQQFANGFSNGADVNQQHLDFLRANGHGDVADAYQDALDSRNGYQDQVSAKQKAKDLALRASDPSAWFASQQAVHDALSTDDLGSKVQQYSADIQKREQQFQAQLADIQQQDAGYDQRAQVIAQTNQASISRMQGRAMSPDQFRIGPDGQPWTTDNYSALQANEQAKQSFKLQTIAQRGQINAQAMRLDQDQAVLDDAKQKYTTQASQEAEQSRQELLADPVTRVAQQSIDASKAQYTQDVQSAQQQFSGDDDSLNAATQKAQQDHQDRIAAIQTQQQQLGTKLAEAAQDYVKTQGQDVPVNTADDSLQRIAQAHGVDPAALGSVLAKMPKVDTDSALGTFWSELKAGFLPAVGSSVGGLLGGGAAGAAGLVSGPGAIATAIAGNVAGGAAGSAAGEYANKLIMGDAGVQKLRDQLAADEKTHPVAAMLGKGVNMLAMLFGGEGKAFAGTASKIANAAEMKTMQRLAGTATEDAVQLAAKNAGDAAAKQFLSQRLVKLAESASAGGRLSASEQAQTKVEGGPEADKITLASALGNTLQGAVTMSPLGLLPHAKSALLAIGLKAPTEAAMLALANQTYNHFVNGQPFNQQQFTEQAKQDIPAFMAQAAMVALGGKAWGKLSSLHSQVQTAPDISDLAKRSNELDKAIQKGANPADTYRASTLAAIGDGQIKQLPDNYLHTVGLGRDENGRLYEVPRVIGNAGVDASSLEKPDVVVDPHGNPIITQDATDWMKTNFPVHAEAIKMSPDEAAGHFAAKSVEPGQATEPPPPSSTLPYNRTLDLPELQRVQTLAGELEQHGMDRQGAQVGAKYVVQRHGPDVTVDQARAALTDPTLPKPFDVGSNQNLEAFKAADKAAQPPPEPAKAPVAEVPAAPSVPPTEWRKSAGEAIAGLPQEKRKAAGGVLASLIPKLDSLAPHMRDGAKITFDKLPGDAVSPWSFNEHTGSINVDLEHAAEERKQKGFEDEKVWQERAGGVLNHELYHKYQLDPFLKSELESGQHGSLEDARKAAIQKSSDWHEKTWLDLPKDIQEEALRAYTGNPEGPLPKVVKGSDISQQAGGRKIAQNIKSAAYMGKEFMRMLIEGRLKGKITEELANTGRSARIVAFLKDFWTRLKQRYDNWTGAPEAKARIEQMANTVAERVQEVESIKPKEETSNANQQGNAENTGSAKPKGAETPKGNAPVPGGVETGARASTGENVPAIESEVKGEHGTSGAESGASTGDAKPETSPELDHLREIYGVKDHPAFEGILKRAEGREEREKGPYGKFGEMSRKDFLGGEGQKLTALAAHPDLRKALGLPDMPTSPTDMPKGEAKHKASDAWQEAAQHTMDALAKEAGVARSSMAPEDMHLNVMAAISELDPKNQNGLHDSAVETLLGTRVIHDRIKALFGDSGVKRAIDNAQKEAASPTGLTPITEGILKGALVRKAKELNITRGPNTPSGKDWTAVSTKYAIPKFLDDIRAGRVLSGRIPSDWLARQYAQHETSAGRELPEPSSQGNAGVDEGKRSKASREAETALGEITPEIRAQMRDELGVTDAEIDADPARQLAALRDLGSIGFNPDELPAQASPLAEPLKKASPPERPPAKDFSPSQRDIADEVGRQLIQHERNSVFKELRNARIYLPPGKLPAEWDWLGSEGRRSPILRYLKDIGAVTNDAHTGTPIDTFVSGLRARLAGQGETEHAQQENLTSDDLGKKIVEAWNQRKEIETGKAAKASLNEGVGDQQQHYDFTRDILHAHSDAPNEIPASELRKGDVLSVGGNNLTVKDVDENGSVELRGKTKYGNQTVPESTILHYGELTRAEKAPAEDVGETPFANARITPEEDEAYLEAAKKGDTATARRMVDDAANYNDYSTEGWHVTGGSGGSGAARGRTVTDKFDDESHFFDSKEAADAFAEKSGGKVIPVYLKFDKLRRMNDIGHGWSDAVTRTLDLDKGYDGIVYDNDYEGGGDSYLTFWKEQIKSADPIASDAHGDIIPLSERFNSDNPNINHANRREVLDHPDLFERKARPELRAPSAETAARPTSLYPQAASKELSRLKPGELPTPLKDDDALYGKAGEAPYRKLQGIRRAMDVVSKNLKDGAPNARKQWDNLVDAYRDTLKPLDDIEKAQPVMFANKRETEQSPIDEAAHEAATSPQNDLKEPTEGQIDAGNFPSGHAKLGGMGLTIQHPAGTRRRPEWQPLQDHYGHLKGTRSGDNENMDAFVKPGTPEDYKGPVFVVNQLDRNGEHDEHKSIFGARNAGEARSIYLRNYPAEQRNRIGSIAEFANPESFREWAEGHTRRAPAKGEELHAPESLPRESTLEDGSKVQFVKAKQDRDHELVDADPDKLMSSLSKDKNFYVPAEGGGSEIPGRIAGFNEWMKKGEPVEAPRGGADENGNAFIANGRHRLAALVSKGIDRVPIAVEHENADEFRQKFGADDSRFAAPRTPEEMQDHHKRGIDLNTKRADAMQARIGAHQIKEEFARKQMEDPALKAQHEADLKAGKTPTRLQWLRMDAQEHQEEAQPLIERRDRYREAAAEHKRALEELRNAPAAEEQGEDEEGSQFAAPRIAQQAVQIGKGLAAIATKQPDFDDGRKAVNRLTGQDQIDASKVNKFTDEFRKAVPSQARREAITAFNQAKGNNATLDAWTRLPDGKLARAASAAKNLTPEERAWARKVDAQTQVSDSPRLWEKPIAPAKQDELAQKQAGYKTFADAVSDGFKPRTMDAANLYGNAETAKNQDASRKQLLADLKTGKAKDGAPLAVPSGKADYRYKTSTNPATMGLAFHRDVAPSVDAAFGRSALRDWVDSRSQTVLQEAAKRGVNLASQLSSAVKSGMFALSGFHVVTEGTHALGHLVNPFKFTKFDPNDTDHVDAVKHGLMTGEHSHEENDFLEGLSGGPLKNVAGIGKVFKAAADFTGKYVSSIKLNTYKAVLPRNLALFKPEIASGKMTESDVKYMTAKQINDGFGHLNFVDMGANPTVQYILGLGLLAPDFLRARLHFAGSAIKGLAGQKSSREQAMAMAILGAGFYVGARALNALLNNGDPKWDAEHAFGIQIGNRMISMRSVPEDLAHLWNDPGKFIGGRLSPLVNTGIQAVTGRDHMGNKQSLASTLGQGAAQAIPMPLKNLPGIKSLTDPNNPLSALEGLAGAFGLGIKPSSAMAPAMKLADKWKAANGKEDAGAYPPSQYGKLKDALEGNNQGVARSEIARLATTVPAQDLAKHLRSSIFHAWTGNASDDQQFLASLTPYQRKDVEKGEATRKLMWARAQALGLGAGMHQPVSHPKKLAVPPMPSRLASRYPAGIAPPP